MVTIDPDKSIASFTQLKKSNRMEGQNGNDFDRLFNKLVGETTTEPSGLGTSTLVSDIRPSQFNNPSPPDASGVVDRVQQLLDTMETYQQKLIGGRTTLKEIEPLMNTMAGQGESLAEFSKEIKNEDELRAIVNQSLTLVSVEIARFKNGDYNDA